MNRTQSFISLFFGLILSGGSVYAIQPDPEPVPRHLSITEAYVVEDEKLVIKGHNLCRNDGELPGVTLGTTYSLDALIVLECNAGVDANRDLDRVETSFPLNLNPATYSLSVNRCELDDNSAVGQSK